jgi:hypothetical protein
MGKGGAMVREGWGEKGPSHGEGEMGRLGKEQW